MLKIISNLPQNVLGVSAEGKITGADYETVLIPALEEKLKSNKKINLLYHLGEKFDSFEMAAMWDDAKVGLKHLASWNKVAVVTDIEMVRSFTKIFGYMLSCEARVFKNDELEEAEKWIVS